MRTPAALTADAAQEGPTASLGCNEHTRGSAEETRWRAALWWQRPPWPSWRPRQHPRSQDLVRTKGMKTLGRHGGRGRGGRSISLGGAHGTGIRLALILPLHYVYKRRLHARMLDQCALSHETLRGLRP